MIITGFSEFPGVKANPTRLLMQRWQKRKPSWASQEAIFEVLPVEYQRGEARIRELVANAQEDIFLMLGVSGMGSTIQLERFALNVDDAQIADEAGERREGGRIADSGPIALETSHQLPPLQKKLQEQDVAVTVSNHAGAYVCNHCYYSALLAADDLPTQAKPLFVHVPLVSQTTDSQADMATYLDELEDQIGKVITNLQGSS